VTVVALRRGVKIGVDCNIIPQPQYEKNQPPQIWKFEVKKALPTISVWTHLVLWVCFPILVFRSRFDQFDLQALHMVLTHFRQNYAPVIGAGACIRVTRYDICTRSVGTRDLQYSVLHKL